MTPELTALLDDYWRRALPGLGVVRDGVRLGAHAGQLAGYDGVYVVVRGDAALVSAPPGMCEMIARQSPTPAAVKDPAWWSVVLPTWDLLGPSIHSFLSTTGSLPAGVNACRRSLADVARALHDRVDAEEWVEGGFDDDGMDEAWVLMGADDEPVAAARLTPFDGKLADVGLITAADQRGRGYGRLVGSVAARWAVEQHGLARWRARSTNVASRRIALSLGFMEDATQLALRPPTQGVALEHHVRAGMTPA